MQMRRGGASRVAGQGDHDTRANGVTLVHEHARSMTVHGFISVGMAQEYEHPIVGVCPRRRHRAATRGPDPRPDRGGDIDPGVGLTLAVPLPYFAAGHEAIEA